MNWLANKVINVIKWAHKNAEQDIIIAGNASGKTKSKSSEPLETSRGIRINCIPATGGMIIDTTRYDDIVGARVGGFYIVRDDQDLGVEIGKIIVFETLK